MISPFFHRVIYYICAFSFIFNFAYSSSVAAAPKIIRDEEIERILKVYASPIFDQAGLDRHTVNLILVESPELNAFVAGGMNIFVYTGLILETEDPGEVIGVLAHETSHISSGHLIRTKLAMEHASKQSILTTLLGIAAALGTGSAEAGTAITLGGQNIVGRQFLAHSRANEASADQGAANFLKKAKLSPIGLHSFMEKLSSEELLPTSQQSEYVRTHPLTLNRVKFLARMVEESRYAEKPLPAEWLTLHQRMQAKLIGYLYPDRALRNQKSDFASQYAKAIAYYRKNKKDFALTILNQLIKQEPYNPYLYELKGQILLENGLIEDAIAPNKRAISLLPDASLFRVTYAHNLLELKNAPTDKTLEALRQLKYALKKEKTSPRVHRLLATAYGRLDNKGYARLHLAEEALLQNHPSRAIRQALYAQEDIEKGTSGWYQLQDLMQSAKKRLVQKGKR